MKFTAIIAALMLSSTPALAQSSDNTNTSQSEALSYSGIQTHGDNVYSSSVSAPSGNSTAPCVIAQAGGIAAMGTGFSYGTGVLDGDCVTRIEAMALAELVAMPVQQRRIAVAHFCVNDETMRRTLVTVGWCVVQSQ